MNEHILTWEKTLMKIDVFLNCYSVEDLQKKIHHSITWSKSNEAFTTERLAANNQPFSFLQ
jgi:hypothetical protein